MTFIKQLHPDLRVAILLSVSAVILLLMLIIICHLYADKLVILSDPQNHIFYRSLFYVFAIITLPLMQFIRHIMLRLNRKHSVKIRYLATITVMMLIAESIGLYGFILFILGDAINNLYIFSGLSTLAIFIHKPNKEEYLNLKNSF